MTHSRSGTNWSRLLIFKFLSMRESLTRKDFQSEPSTFLTKLEIQAHVNKLQQRVTIERKGQDKARLDSETFQPSGIVKLNSKHVMQQQDELWEASANRPFGLVPKSHSGLHDSAHRAAQRSEVSPNTKESCPNNDEQLNPTRRIKTARAALPPRAPQLDNFTARLRPSY